MPLLHTKGCSIHGSFVVTNKLYDKGYRCPNCKHIIKHDIRIAENILELYGDITYESIIKAYKIKASIHHPDKGGNHEDFIRIREAMDIVIFNYVPINKLPKKYLKANPTRSFSV